MYNDFSALKCNIGWASANYQYLVLKLNKAIVSYINKLTEATKKQKTLIRIFLYWNAILDEVLITTSIYGVKVQQK